MAKTQQKGTSIGDGTITEVDINISGATVKSPLLGSDYLFIRDSVLNTTQQILVSTLDDYYASKYFPSADNMSYAVSAGSYSFVPTTKNTSKQTSKQFSHFIFKARLHNFLGFCFHLFLSSS